MIKCDNEFVNFADLKPNDCFLLNNELWMKEEEDQYATNLCTGGIRNNLCGTMVLPVDVEIKWTKKVAKKATKKATKKGEK